jgi:enamine deaminase RidA (YjgF/YER057c/UK114 family)
MPQTVVQVPEVLAYEPFGFTNCVRWGDALYLSGISALTKDGEAVGAEDIAVQTVKTYENIRAVLTAAGSGLDRILQMTSFVVDLPRNGRAYVEARRRILTSHTYTSAVIGVSALMIPGLVLEVQCIAAVDGRGVA